MTRRAPRLLDWMPDRVQRHVMHFEAAIDAAVREFANELIAGSNVLDAGAGEGQYAKEFSQHRYIGLDLGIGDVAWNYSSLDVIGDLGALPFRSNTFDACINIVTLEHVPDPALVLAELCRVTRPSGRLLLVTPHEWEEHQQPHDYYRYTRYGLAHLLSKSGYSNIRISPVGGFFRLLSRRLLNGIKFFPGLWAVPAAALLGPPALVLPWFDRLDRTQNFTLGHICTAQKSRQF
jgi:SAM-dependent methyltransferase